MIFGHHLDFQNEPVLREEYSGYPAASADCTSKIIPVVESDHIDNFPLKTDWVELSGQLARYYSLTPYEKSNGCFPWALEIQCVLTLTWDAVGQKIIYKKGKNYTPERLRFWIYHTFFPIVLELERIYRILHVGAVEVEGKPILFSAPSFGGKSTLTDYFLQCGHRLLSDDSLGIDKRGDDYYAIPSYPFHRPYRELETLGCFTKNFFTEVKPLHAIFCLEKVDAGVAVEISEVKGIEKFKAFHYSSFIDFHFMKQDRFLFFTEMAKHISVYTVKVPQDIERLNEVYATIMDQCIP